MPGTAMWESHKVHEPYRKWIQLQEEVLSRQTLQFGGRGVKGRTGSVFILRRQCFRDRQCQEEELQGTRTDKEVYSARGVYFHNGHYHVLGMGGGGGSQSPWTDYGECNNLEGVLTSAESARRLNKSWAHL